MQFVLPDTSNLLPESKVHIRIKQRNARSYLTSVENLPTDYDLSIILKKMKKSMHCSGSIIEKSVIQLTGDQRQAIRTFLITNNLVDENSIVIHGY